MGSHRAGKALLHPVPCQVTLPCSEAGDRDVKWSRSRQNPRHSSGKGKGKKPQQGLFLFSRGAAWGRVSVLIRDHSVVPIHFEPELELDCSTLSLLNNENNSSSTPHPSPQPLFLPAQLSFSCCLYFLMSHSLLGSLIPGLCAHPS